MPSQPYNFLLLFSLDEQRYALPVSNVERVVRVAEVTPLPRAPEIILGVINMQGNVIPVVNVRRRFRLPEREMALSDQLLIARTSRRIVALVVDSAAGLVEHSPELVIAAEQIVPGLDYIAGVAKLEGGIVLIHDLDAFLSLEEELRLDEALQAGHS